MIYYGQEFWDSSAICVTSSAPHINKTTVSQKIDRIYGPTNQTHITVFGKIRQDHWKDRFNIHKLSLKIKVCLIKIISDLIRDTVNQSV